MAAATISRPDIFPDGTSVGAYPQSAFPPTTSPSGVPPGSATTTATAAAGVVAFTGLAANTAYYAAASVSGTWRYLSFRAAPSTETYPDGMTAPGSNSAAVTTSNTTLLAVASRAIYVGVTGDLTVLTVGGQTTTFTAVPAGAVLPIQVQRVNATGTTATNIVAIW